MVSIKDISKVSGFSVTTVSRALNDFDDVSPKTKRYIKKVANDLHYSPNKLARSLVNQKSKTFGFITNDFSSSSPLDNFSFNVFMDALDYANENDYDVIWIQHRGGEETNKTFNQVIAERNLAGAIIQGFDADDPFCEEASQSDTPTVFIDMALRGPKTTYIALDVNGAVKQGMSLLSEQGYQRLGFLYGSERSWITREWLKAVKKYMHYNPNQFKSVSYLSGDYNLDKSRQVVDQFLKNQSQNSKTAIFASTDVMAIGALKAINRLKLSIPSKIGVLGVDNIALGRFVTPELTTLGQDLNLISKQAIESLMSLPQKNVAPILNAPRLIRRETI